MFRVKKQDAPSGAGVENLKKALWYAEKGLYQRARIAAKAALLELKEAEMPSSTQK